MKIRAFFISLLTTLLLIGASLSIADNSPIYTGDPRFNGKAGNWTLASDDIGDIKFPRVKIVTGADNVNGGDVSASNPLPVNIVSGGGGGGGGTVDINQTTPGTTDSVTVKASAGIGSLIETAPATDTASSGLNGRLQRIAQRLTSIIGVLPSSLTGSGNLKVAEVEGRSKTVTTLLNAVTSNQTSGANAFGTGRRTFQASISGTGAVSATVTWYGSNANAASGGVLLATMTLSGTGSDTAGADIPAEWPYVYCVLSSISGTSAAVTATVGI